MRPLNVLLPVLALLTIGCRPPCGQTIFTGGKATITLSITEPEEVETTWTVRGGTKEELEASLDPANDFIDYQRPGDIREWVEINTDRGVAENEAESSLSASVPADEIGGLSCVEGAELTGFEVQVGWNRDGGQRGDVEVWGPEHDFHEPIATGTTSDVEVTLDSETSGSVVAREVVWQRIVGPALLVEDCPERATVTARWELDPDTRTVDAEDCDDERETISMY